jgi:hypothetical protein
MDEAGNTGENLLDAAARLVGDDPVQLPYGAG